MITRRMLLLGTTALVGCQSVPGQSSQLVDDVNSIVAALQNLAPSLGQFLTPANLALAVQYIAQAATIAQQIATIVATGSPTASAVSQFASIVNAVLALFGVNLPPEVQTVVQAIISLLPIILLAAGVVATPGPLPAEQARAVLR